MKLVLTCEHGGNEIPPEYQKYFVDGDEELNSHRGLDLGALDLFKHLEKLADYSKYATTSRLLVELNRSLYHPKLFSEFTRSLRNETREQILKDYYLPYRDAVKEKITEFIANGKKVIHISVHSFTPVLNDVQRNAQIGLLYDPLRANEKAFCNEWKAELNKQAPKLKVRYNYPYLGNADGFTTYLRKQFPKNYMGMELEVNQRWVENGLMDGKIKKAILDSLSTVIGSK